MPLNLDDTIVAIASPPGGAARGIVRVGGLDVVACVDGCFRAEVAINLDAITTPRAVAGEWIEIHGPAIPCDVYLWPTARSYTRQPMAEVHTLGSPPLLERVVRSLCRRGARPAEPGEFTLRAFLAGRLDLTQAEAVLGVIDAADAGQFEVALRQLAGGVAGPLDQLREELLDLLAHLEAGLDFVEEDIAFIQPDELLAQLDQAKGRIEAVAGQMASRTVSGEAFRAALVGWPNVGKSSLFNALVRGEASGRRALVAPRAGTTRDYLTAEVDLGDIRVEIIDTAGIDTAEIDAAGRDPIDVEAQSLASNQHRCADLRVHCLDATRPPNAWEQSQLAHLADTDLLVLTKGDLISPGGRLRPIADQYPSAIVTSSHTRQGIDELRDRLRDAAIAVSRCEHVVAVTAARCRESLHAASEAIARAAGLVREGAGEELVATELRVALDAIGQVVGAVYTDDVLDRVFSRFCIGK